MSYLKSNFSGGSYQFAINWSLIIKGGQNQNKKIFLAQVIASLPRSRLRGLVLGDSYQKSLETVVNTELIKVGDWLHANKLRLNTKKSNYVIFHPYQKKTNY